MQFTSWRDCWKVNLNNAVSPETVVTLYLKWQMCQSWLHWPAVKMKTMSKRNPSKKRSHLAMHRHLVVAVAVVVARKRSVNNPKSPILIQMKLPRYCQFLLRSLRLCHSFFACADCDDFYDFLKSRDWTEAIKTHTTENGPSPLTIMTSAQHKQKKNCFQLFFIFSY